MLKLHARCKRGFKQLEGAIAEYPLFFALSFRQSRKMSSFVVLQNCLNLIITFLSCSIDLLSEKIKSNLEFKKIDFF